MIRRFHTVVLSAILATAYFCAGIALYPGHSFLLLQFIAIVTLTLLILASVISGRRRADRRLQLHKAVTQIFADAVTLSDAMQEVLRTIGDSDGWNAGAIWTIDRERNEMVCSEIWRDASLKSECENYFRQKTFSRGNNLPHQFWENGEGVFTTDLAAGDYFSAQPAGQTQLRSALFVPLKSGGEILGVLAFFSRRVRDLDDGLQMFTAMGCQVGQFIQQMTAKNRLTMLAHAMQSTTEIIYIVNQKNQFTFVNCAFEQITGYAEKEILGKPADMIFSPNNPPGLKETISEQSRRGRWSGEVLHKRKNGAEFPALLSMSPIVSTDGSIHSWTVVAQDVSEYKRAQADLQRLATVVADSEDAIISMTLHGAIVTWNRAAQRIYGFSADEAIGRSCDIVFPPVSADKISQILESVALGEKVKSNEMLCRRKNSSLFETFLTISPICDASGKVIGASMIARDISERRKLEREVLEISAQERRRIGYELHDGLSQHLAGIAFKAKSLQDSLAEEEAAHTGAAHEIVELVNDAMRQTRQVARSLDPTEVEASGLVAALERFCGDTSAVFHVDCQFKCKEPQLPLEAPTNLALFRIAQEAVRNALVHGGPEKIEVKLFFEGERLNLSIRDDGKGFDPAKRSSGVGLRLMQYRAHTIHGAFQLSSQPGAGTLVQCSVPFSISAPPKIGKVVYLTDHLECHLNNAKNT
jgi:two-component system sensor kinase FixL